MHNLLNRGVKHGFPFINIRKVPREVFSTLPRDLANINKIMFDRYNCIDSTKHCENVENIRCLRKATYFSLYLFSILLRAED